MKADGVACSLFYEEELVNEVSFLYYNLLKETIKNTTLIQDSDSQLLKKNRKRYRKFLFKRQVKALCINCRESYYGSCFI